MTPYIVFAAAIGAGAVMSWLLPGRLGTPENKVEELVLLGLLPVMVWVVWTLRRPAGERPPEAAPPQPPKQP